MEKPAITNILHAARIGLIADSHCGDTRALPPSVFEAFRDVVLIVHLGDCGAASGLDALEEIAPVIATRGGDDSAADPRYAGVRVINAGGVRIGALFDPKGAGIALDDDRAERLRKAIEATFGTAVDVVAFASTHQSLVSRRDGILFVNPGSPTLPAKPGPRGLGTVAILEVRNGAATAEVIDL